jgi:periodic tryptophan protein 1
MTISAVAWVPKGASKEIPEKFALTEDEFSRIEASISERLEQSRADLKEAQQDASMDDASSKKKGGRKGKVQKAEATSDEKTANGEDPDAAIIKEFNLDNYDDDDDVGMDVIESEDDDEETARLKQEEIQGRNPYLISAILQVKYGFLEMSPNRFCDQL